MKRKGRRKRRWCKIKEKIDWSKFKDEYVRLVAGAEKRLKLTNWTGGEWFGKPGINFDVILEDGKKVTEKHFTVTSRRLIRELKPILLKADEEDRDTLSISILRTGESQNTRYSVHELPPSFKELFK